MKDFIQEVIIKAIPWLIPFVLFCSWVYNWKSNGTSGDTKGTGGSAKSQKKETPEPPSDSADTPAE